jgi:hypothetical protein
MNGQPETLTTLGIQDTRHNTETNKIKIKQRKQNRQQSWMDNIEYTGHNTETKKIKTKHRKLNRQQSWMDNRDINNIRYTRHNTETNKIKTKHRKLKRWIQVLVKGKHVLPLIGHPSLYWYGTDVLETIIYANKLN